MSSPEPRWTVLPRLRRLVRLLGDRLPLVLRLRRPSPAWSGKGDRYAYQSRWVEFDIRERDRVLDIGSGGHPFPHATVLVDRYPGRSRHRHEPFRRAGKPVVVGDVAALPLGTGSVDYVYCSHLLEHVDDPIAACREIMRVGRRGYIETPTPGKDVLFAWGREMHRWRVAASADTLCFFEATPRQREGIRSRAWEQIVFDRWYHPLQEAFWENLDVFNVMFPWEGSFSVLVFRLDGTAESYNAEIRDRGGDGREDREVACRSTD